MTACKPGERVYTRLVAQQAHRGGDSQTRRRVPGRHRRTPATGPLQEWRRQWGKEWGAVGAAIGKAIREGRA